MALQSEVSPTIVGDPNKDTQIDGDTKSDGNHSSQSTDEEADLEDGEIAESEGEEEKDFSNVSLKEALDKSCLQNIEQLVNQAKNAKVISSPDRSKIASPRKSKRMPDNYMDHDRAEPGSDQEKGWFPSSPKYKNKFGDKPVDYRMELAAYRGTPPSSPDRSGRRAEKSKKKRSSKKSKKTKKTIRRKDIKGQRVAGFKRDAARGKVCKFFKEGKCAKGSDCYFSHTVPSFKKKDLCKFYLNGHCNKGKDCMYMHSEFPCKFYHTGSECYAKSDCRFSHAPLSEEMKKVLADYLRSCHGDDLRHNRNDDRDRETNDFHRDRNDFDRDRNDFDRDRDRKRPISLSPEPPPPKRTCLLGSPPRHIREAEETKRWQEEMKMLQQSHPSFEIQLSPNRDDMAQSEFQKPNFYQDTLLNTPSPKKRPPNMDAPNSFNHSNMDDYDVGSPSKVYVYDEDEFIEIDVSAVKQEPQQEYHHWENVNNMPPHSVQNHAKPFVENTHHQELDFTTDIKFDETTQFSEMESSTDCLPVQSPDSNNLVAHESTLNNESSKLPEHLNQSGPNPTLAPPPPIVVPTHLPRRQQELFMRVLQHQRQNVGRSPDTEDNVSDSQVKKEPDSEEEKKFEMGPKESEWYTSEEEDDDDDYDNDGQLAKNIQQAPPQPQEVKPAAKVDLLAIFNTIQQKTKDKNKGLTDIQQKHSSFWQNILGGVNASKAAQPPASNPAPLEPPKRRTLLPDPVPSIVKTEPVTPAEPPAIKDPRLKNRDPRKISREPKLEISIPKPTNIVSTQELGSPPTKPVTTSEQVKESIPYKLRGISAKPLNYTPYLHASQSNPSLLKDPRLRKHLQNNDPVNGNEKDHDSVKLPVPPKNAPPIPELLLKYEKPVAAINIFESSSSSKSTEKSDAKPSINVTVPVTYDPSDMKGRVPIPVPVIPLLDSKICLTVPVAYDPVDSKGRAPIPVTYEPMGSKSPTPILSPVTYKPLDSKNCAPVPVTASFGSSDLKISLCTPVTVSNNAADSKSCAPFTSTLNPLDTKKRAPKPSTLNPRVKRRDSRASNSGSDTPPHLTIVDSSAASPPQEFKSAPVLENAFAEPKDSNEKEKPEEKKHIPPVPEKSSTPPPLIEKDSLTDIKKEIESDSDSNQDPPPLASKVSRKRSLSPPIVEEFMTVIKKEVPQDCSSDSKPIVPPLIIKKVKPNPVPASHLPRAIADPRMAKLHNPRRPRVAPTNKSPRRVSERRKAADAAKETVTEPSPAKSPKTSKTKEAAEEKPKAVKSIPKKRRLSDKSEEKKKTVHRNRKSSMDYASPLNSCDATDESKSLNYNRYNQRPKRGVNVTQPVKVSPSAAHSPSDSSSIPEFALSDSSNLECDNSNDVNLKDRFKTIDPTASPFC